MLSTTAKNPGLVARRCCTLTPNLPTFAKHSRGQSTATQFYQNRQLELYASKETKRLTLRQLASMSSTTALSWKLTAHAAQVFFGRSMNEERLITARTQHLQAQMHTSDGSFTERKLCPDGVARANRT